MIVITLTNCPLALRGDLTKWLFEIDTNVFVGRVSARVREQLWARVELYCDKGRATMVFNTNNEQHFDFRVHNSSWEPRDFDGFKLMLRPIEPHASRNSKTNGYSKASHYLSIKQQSTIKKCKNIYADKNICDEEALHQPYTIIDIETTGPSIEKDTIIQMNALHISDNRIIDSISISVQPNIGFTSRTTGSTKGPKDLPEEEKPLHVALEEYLSFIGDGVLVGYKVRLNMGFISAACKVCDFEVPTNLTDDVFDRAKKKLHNLRSHSIDGLAEYYGITSEMQS